MNVVLLGYHGCGKTTLGKALAGRLWKKFVDLDLELIRPVNGTRDATEQATVEAAQQAFSHQERVITLPAEAPASADFKQTVKQAPQTLRIYLKCGADTLCRRLHQRNGTVTASAVLPGPEATCDDTARALARFEPHYLDLADRVFDVSELDVQGAIHHLIRRCL